MILPCKTIVYKYLNSGLIAPHGMTDLVHADQYNLTPELYKINLLTTATHGLIHLVEIPYLLNILFVGMSIVHFRRDFPKIKQIPRFLLSSIFLLFSLSRPELFFLYMALIHVPHHYNLNWKYLKKAPLLSIISLSVSTFFSLLLSHNYGTIVYKNPFILDTIKGIIVSHIIYEETYLYENDFFDIFKKQINYNI